MTVLPKFLYIFQCLPIFLTKSFFCNLNTQITSFIWNKKRPRAMDKVLQRPRSLGGLALPNFLYYYWSVNIRAILYLLGEDEKASWAQMEKSSIRYNPLSVLCSRLPLAHSVSNLTLSPVVLQAIKIWFQFRRHFALNNLPLASPIVQNHIFTPSMTDAAFDIWSKNGIRSLHDLYFNVTFASFEQLVQKFTIPHTHFFRYLQLRSFVSSNSNRFPHCPAPSLIDSILEYRCGEKQSISKVYGLLNLHNLTALESLKQKWEKEIEDQLPDDVWQEAIRRIHSSSISLRHTIVQFKIVHRLHWSKDRLAKFKSDVDPNCDRCKQAPATLFHMFWSCPKLLEYWGHIFETFSKMFGKFIAPDISTAIFGVASLDNSLSRSQSDVIAFCTLLARRLILYKWKDSSSPTYGDWIKDVMYNIQLEKLRCSMNWSNKRFLITWQPLLTFVENTSAKKLF